MVNAWTLDGQEIHNNYKIVDKIKEMGPTTVTIFQKIEDGYLRISTNVITKAGRRAVGTFIPNESEVIKTIEKGNRYQGRAYVVDDWYTTIYDPIYINGEIQGILYVGEKESAINMFKQESKSERYLGDGYAFVMSDNTKFNGLMLMHPTLEGINVRTSGNIEYLELYNELISDYTQKEETEASRIIRIKNTSLGKDVFVYYTYHEIFHYYIGIVVPYDSFLGNEMQYMVELLLWRFAIGLPIVVLLVFLFTFIYKKRLGRIIYSLHQLGKGIIPKPIRENGRDEIAQTAKFINTLASSNKELIRNVKRVEDGEYDAKVRMKSDRDQLAISFNNMAKQLYDFEDKHQHQLMMRKAENDLFERTRFANDMDIFGQNALRSIANYLPIQVGCFYYYHEAEELLTCQSSIGISDKTNFRNIKLGEGLIGEVAARKIEVKEVEDIPKDFYKLKTGIGECDLKQLIIIPLVLNDNLLGVIEIASVNIFSVRHWDLLNVYKESLAISLNISKSRIETQTLLEQIQVQSEELRVSNETLEEQANALQVSEEDLQVQQEELRVSNEELEVQASSLRKSEEALLTQKETLEQEMKKRVEAQTQLELSIDKAHAATQAKSMFLANMSHEIRTPMNGIIGISDILAETSLSAEQTNYLKLISSSANNLLTIINDILDFSKIEAGKIEMEEIPFSVKSLIEDTADVLQFKAAEQNNSIFTYIDNEVPVSLIGDPVRLQQILMNLASNAVKFTHNGEVTLSCEVKDIKEQKVHLLFKVKDTGIGISKEGQNKLFQSFSQVDASTTRKFGGTGLGLVISKKLAEKMGGEFSVESKEGKGSTFMFSAYFDIDANEQITIDNRDYKELSTLVIDNHEPSCLIFRKYLEAKNAKVETVNSTIKAISLIEQRYKEKKPFQLVFVDYQMPDMNGIQFVKKIQSNKHFKDLKFILLTTQQNVISGELRKKLSIASSLDKPIKRMSLYHAIEKVVYGIETEDSSSQQAKKDKKEVPDTRKKLKILLTEDNVINQKVAVYNLKEWGHEVEVADNGEISIQKFKDGDFDLILMDIQMPVLDGLKATKEIRAYEKENQLKPIKIIAMTANALKGDDQICFDAGMNNYISKPFKKTDLENIIYQ